MIYVLALFGHWIADFVFQSDNMALNKSKSLYWLFIHSLVYAYIMTVFTHNKVIGFVVLLFSHILIDGVTSRVNARLWRQGMRHWFFVSIGFDQWLHFLVIAALI